MPTTTFTPVPGGTTFDNSSFFAWSDPDDVVGFASTTQIAGSPGVPHAHFTSIQFEDSGATPPGAVVVSIKFRVTHSSVHTTVGPGADIIANFIGPLSLEWDGQPNPRNADFSQTDEIDMTSYGFEGSLVSDIPSFPWTMAVDLASIENGVTYTYTITALEIEVEYSVPAPPAPGPSIRRPTVRINDVLNDAPNTASFTCDSVAPKAGQRLKLGVDASSQRLAGSMAGASIGPGTLDADLLFSGSVQAVQQTFDDQRDQLFFGVSAVDDLFFFNKRRPFGKFTNKPADFIAKTIIAAYAPTFTTSNIQTPLPNVSVIFDGTLTLGEAMTFLAHTIEGSWRIDPALVGSGDVKLFLSETTIAPDPLDDTNTTLLNPPQLVRTVDTSQVRNRIFIQGKGTTVAKRAAPGATRIPLEKAGVIPSGSKVIVDGQIFTVAGATAVPVISLPGPVTAPTPTQIIDPNPDPYLEANYQFKVAFFDADDSYESAPSPASATIHLDGTNRVHLTGLPVGDPGQYRRVFISIQPLSGSTTPNWSDDNSGHVVDINDDSTTDLDVDIPVWTRNFDVVGTYEMFLQEVILESGAWGFEQFAGDTYNILYPSPLTDAAGSGTWAARYFTDRMVINTPTGPVLATSVNDLPAGFIPVTINVQSGIFIVPDNMVDPNLRTDTIYNYAGAEYRYGSVSGNPYPGSSEVPFKFPTPQNGVSLFTGGLHFRTSVSWINFDAPLIEAVKSTGATASVVGQYGIETLIGPGGGPRAHYAKGATEIKVDPSTFSASGGTTAINGQIVTYTGKTPDSITGIPASGPFSLECPVPTADTTDGDLAAPGVQGGACAGGEIAIIVTPALTQEILAGTPINLWYQFDDLESQANMGAVEKDDDGNLTDGIHEFTIVDDTLDTIGKMFARASAEATLFAKPIRTIEYSTRDTKTKTGRTVHADLYGGGIFDANIFDPDIFDTDTDEHVFGDYLIQSVRIDQIDEGMGLIPRYAVTASSVRFTLADLLRRIIVRN